MENFPALHIACLVNGFSHPLREGNFLNKKSYCGAKNGYLFLSFCILHCLCSCPCTVTCSAVSSEVRARVWRDLVSGAGPVFVYRAADCGCGPHHPPQNGMGK